LSSLDLVQELVEEKIHDSRHWKHRFFREKYHNQIFFIIEIAPVHMENDPEVKQKKLEILLNETLPFYLDKLDDIVKENNGFLANGKVKLDQ
jgi:hypothetical protein